MYLDYWQLHAKPFEPHAEGGAYFRCESNEGPLLKLRYAIENRRGAVVLAGPAGVGKTMLAQLLLDELANAFSPRLSIVFPQMSSRDLLVYLAGVLARTHGEPLRHTIEESVRRIETFLVHNAQQGRHAVIVVDEAHLLEDCGALETLRLLLNFEFSGRPTLSLVLVGQPNLISAVGRLPSLDERLSAKAQLRAYTADETAAYVRHRLAAAGAGREIFTADAVEALHYLGHGLPRQINRLGDLALLVGFADRLPRIGPQEIEAISEELVAVGAETAI